MGTKAFQNKIHPSIFYLHLLILSRSPKKLELIQADTECDTEQNQIEQVVGKKGEDEGGKKK